ncbi:hypothetical protein GCM10010400_42780 [Streptomyces aculeolatus]
MTSDTSPLCPDFSVLLHPARSTAAAPMAMSGSGGRYDTMPPGQVGAGFVLLGFRILPPVYARVAAPVIASV